MHTDLEPDGEEKSNEQGNHSTQYERIEHGRDVYAPDQVKTEYKK
jgi:hypothetical protein